MQTSYNGFTGELVKLEKDKTIISKDPCIGIPVKKDVYNLTIYDSEKQATISFSDVKFEDIKFYGGAVTFSG